MSLIARKLMNDGFMDGMMGHVISRNYSKQVVEKLPHEQLRIRCIWVPQHVSVPIY